MAFIKCPRCELNYMQTSDKYCMVCRRDLGLADAPEEDTLDLCPECNEHPIIPGEELCLLCLKELKRNEAAAEEVVLVDDTLAIPSVSAIDEIDIDLPREMPTRVFPEIEEAFEEEEEEEEEESISEHEDEDDEQMEDDFVGIFDDDEDE